MKRTKILIFAALLFVTACAPVFREEIMRNSTLNPSLPELNAAPAGFQGRMYILGGKIINTNNTEEGSLIEAMCLPVDWRGFIDYTESYRGRFMALMPKSKGLLDPLVFRPGRDVTIAGIFKGVKTGMIDKLEVSYSYFEIVKVVLWDEAYYYYGPAWYAPYPAYWYWYDPWYYHPWPYHYYYRR